MKQTEMLWLRGERRVLEKEEVKKSCLRKLGRSISQLLVVENVVNRRYRKGVVKYSWILGQL